MASNWPMKLGASWTRTNPTWSCFSAVCQLARMRAATRRIPPLDGGSSLSDPVVPLIWTTSSWSASTTLAAATAVRALPASIRTRGSRSRPPCPSSLLTTWCAHNFSFWTTWESIKWVSDKMMELAVSAIWFDALHSLQHLCLILLVGWKLRWTKATKPLSYNGVVFTQES